MQNISKCFYEFKKVRIVLVCTEISAYTQATLLSLYKVTMILKFMTGITSADFISYIISSSGGRTSNKTPFEKSGLLDMFVDKIMVAKDFLIENLFECFHFLNKKFNCLRPKPY